MRIKFQIISVTLALLAVLCAGSATRLQAQTNPTTLQISATGPNVNLQWNSGGTLQYASSVTGPWVTYPGNVSVLSSSALLASGAAYFRVVNNGVASTPVSLLPSGLSAPLEVETASLQLLPSPVPAGNTRLVLTLAPGTYSSSNLVTLLINNEVTTLRDDGQFPDQTAGDGDFSAVINVSTNDMNAWNAELTNLPPQAQFSYVFSQRAIVGSNALTAFPTANFLGGQAVTLINNEATPFFNPFTPCSGSPMAYDPYKTEMITNLSVIEDTNRTWDNDGPPAAFGAGGIGTKMGAWTFGRLMTDMANVGAPGNTVTSASDFVLRCFQTWAYQQTINNDSVPAEPNVQTDILQPWLAASEAEGLTNALDLSIAPFRLLAIDNRLDLRDNSSYGGTSQNACVPPEFAGEARFVFGFIDPNLPSNNPYQVAATNQMTVIFEYAVPISGCDNVQHWGAQWAALNSLSFTTPAGSHDLLFNQALQAITDQFAKAGDNPSQMPNQSAIGQVRFNDNMGSEWALRQFNIDTKSGYLVESTVAATPAFPLNATPTTEAFIASQNNSSFCTVGPLLSTPSITIPTMYLGASFLGGWAPEGVATGGTNSSGTNIMSGNGITSGMYWVGTDCTDPCTRHTLSLNTCNACHTEETGTAFTHVSPRAIGSPTTLSGFLTGTTVVDPSGCSSVSYTYSDLQRRVQDLNALVTCGCDYEIAHIPLRMTE